MNDERDKTQKDSTAATGGRGAGHLAPAGLGTTWRAVQSRHAGAWGPTAGSGGPTPAPEGKATVMKRRKPAPEPWPPAWARLPDLDTLEALSRGEPPPPEPPAPSDTATAAQCLFPFAPLPAATPAVEGPSQ
jgi:hypothetical protein